MRKIDKNQIVAAIERMNSWWEGGPRSLFGDLPKRMHYEKIYELIRQRDPHRALVLMGPRRVGKTVLLYQSISKLIETEKSPKKILFVSLDNPLFRLSSLEEIMLWGFESTKTSLDDTYVFYDEVQYIENWEQQLKYLVDNYPQVKFIVTGSATAALHKKSKESGAGRFTDYMLPPLSFYEFMVIKTELDKIVKGSINLEKLNTLYIDYLNYGGFPESLVSQNIRDFPEQYIGQDILDKVLMRDLPSVFGINNPTELNRLFTALAYNTSNEVSLESISKTSGVSKNDIYRYLEYLEAAFLVKTIEKTDNKNQQFKRKTFFKVILANPSLRSAIFGKVKESDPELEGLAETAIFSQLVIHFSLFDSYKYARWNRGNSKGEVDLIHVNKKGAPVTALEIKWTDRYALGTEDPKSLIAFCKENGLKEGFVTSKTVFAERQHGGVTIKHIPTAFVCLMIGCRINISEASKKIATMLMEKAAKGSSQSSQSASVVLESLIKVTDDMAFLDIELTSQDKFIDGLELATSMLK